jgi:hypothetical protein
VFPTPVLSGSLVHSGGHVSTETNTTVAALAASGAGDDSSGATVADSVKTPVRSAGFPAQVVTEVIVAIHSSQPPTGKEVGLQRAFVTASAAPGDMPAVDTQTVSLSFVPAHPTAKVVGNGVGSIQEAPNQEAPNREAPKIAETTLFINGAPPGPVRVPPSANVPSTASIQVAGSYVQAPSVTSTVPADAAVAGAVASAETQTPDNPMPPPSVQVGFTATLSGPISLSNVIEQLVPAAGDSTSGGEKDAGTSATTAAQRKALALGLRYLNPDMTDDEIAQAAGVSRRTLFRWQEYMSIKKALRQLYKRPRGYKDREGNIEGWFEEDE